MGTNRIDTKTKVRLIIKTYLLCKGKASNQELTEFINQYFGYDVTPRFVGSLLSMPAQNTLLWGVKHEMVYDSSIQRNYNLYYFQDGQKESVEE